VQKGDTLYGISRRNSTTVTKLKAANNLTSDTIRPGQVLQIP
jgi:LysM repeat protein